MFTNCIRTRKSHIIKLFTTVFIAFFFSSAYAGQVNLTSSSLTVSAPSGNVTKLVLRVLGPDGIVSLESSGSTLVFDAASQANGDYNYHSWAIAEDADGNRSQVSDVKGNFDIVNGQIIPQQNSSGNIGSNTNQHQSTTTFANIAKVTLDFLFPLANAQSITVDAAVPIIQFEDTTTEGTDTDNREWLIQADDAAFVILDDSNDSNGTNITQVVRIEALGNGSATTKAHQNSLIIEDDGDITFADGAMFLSKAQGKLGLGTTAPDTGIHVVASGKNQYLKLENTTESTWTLGQFDGIVGSTLDGDFRINLEANGNGGPTGTMLSIPDQTGHVGINTNAPTSKLTVAGDTDARVAIINSDSASVVSRVLVNLINNGAPVVQMNDTSSGDQWNFRTGSGGRFVIDSPQGVGGTQMQVFNSGNVSIKGTLTQGSSRTYKDNIVQVNEFDVLEKLKQLSVNEWSYKSELGENGVGGVRHIGPMAEDFHALFGLGANEKGIASLDSAGIALAAVKGLTTMVEQKSNKIDILQNQNAELLMRLEQLERMVMTQHHSVPEVAAF